MSVEPRKQPSRVLAAFDVVPPSDGFWRLAARLAEGLRSELQGLFVEDELLLRVCGFPSAVEYGPWSSLGRTVTLESMEESLRKAANAARRSMIRAAEQSRLSWSFDTVRGSLYRAALRAFEEADLLLTAPPRFSARACPTDAGITAVVYDGTASAARAVDAAVRMNPRSGDCVAVLLLASQGVATATLRQLFGDLSQRRSVISQQIVTPEDCSAIVNRLHAGLLLIGKDCPFAAERDLPALAARLSCPLGLVR
ncbi:MAG: hypothetical protein JNL96_07605 [Planctomycetaceae bacterium]|nr:hypothetical protein [Planctomycetaceae bacterium]